MANYYYARGKQRFGPVSAAQLKQLAASGRLSPDDAVSAEGTSQWVKAGTIKTLFPPVTQQQSDDPLGFLNEAESPRSATRPHRTHGHGVPKDDSFLDELVPSSRENNIAKAQTVQQSDSRWAPASEAPPPAAARPSPRAPNPVPKVLQPPPGAGSTAPIAGRAADMPRAEIINDAAPGAEATYLPCPQCRNYLIAGSSNAGQTVRCPHCGATVQMPEVDVPVAAVPTSVEGLTEGAEPLDFLDQSQSPSTGDRAATSRVHKKSASIWGEAVGELKTSAKGKARVASKFAIKAAIGLAALIVLCSGVAFLGNLAPKQRQSISIQGDTARFDSVVACGVPFIDNLKNAAYETAKKVCDVAKANPKIKTIEVKVKLNKDSGGGLSDKYGHPLTEDIPMGTITLDDLDEVRKYVDSGSYAVDHSVQASYEAQIAAMPYGAQFTK